MSAWCVTPLMSVDSHQDSYFPREALRNSNQSAQSMTLVGWSTFVSGQTEQPIALKALARPSTWWAWIGSLYLDVGGIFGASPVLPFSSTLTRLAPFWEKAMFFIVKSRLPWDFKFLSAPASSLNPASLASVCPTPTFTRDLLLFHLVLPLHKNSAGISLLLTFQPCSLLQEWLRYLLSWPTRLKQCVFIFLFIFLCFFLCWMPRIA